MPLGGVRRELEHSCANCSVRIALSCALEPEHQAFEQRIAGQPIGAMYSRSGGFAPLRRGPARLVLLEIGLPPAHRRSGRAADRESVSVAMSMLYCMQVA